MTIKIEAKEIAQAGGRYEGTYVKEYTLSGGLNKREHFAGLAMQGILSHSFGRGNPEECAIQALLIADALLKELEK